MASGGRLAMAGDILLPMNGAGLFVTNGTCLRAANAGSCFCLSVGPDRLTTDGEARPGAFATDAGPLPRCCAWTGAATTHPRNNADTNTVNFAARVAAMISSKCSQFFGQLKLSDRGQPSVIDIEQFILRTNGVRPSCRRNLHMTDHAVPSGLLQDSLRLLGGSPAQEIQLRVVQRRKKIQT